MTILIADDDTQFRSALRARLSSLGYHVVEASDGLGAIAKSRTEDLQLIILDHQMPLGEGRSVATSVRRNTTAPIIFVSGAARDEFRETVIQVPDSYFLPKPLDSIRLTGLIASLLGNVPTAAHPAC